MPSSKGIPPLTSHLASNTSEGVSRKWLEPWPCTGMSLVVLDSVYSRAAVEPWLRASFRSLKVYSGLEARYPFAWRCSSVGPPSGMLGRVFLRGERERRGSGRRATTVAEWTADTCPYTRVLRERLGESIECGNCSYLFIGSTRWPSTGV
jgi:hypothetical protein